MGKKNKLAELPYQMTVSAYGVTLGLRAARPALLRQFAQAWPYGCEVVDAPQCERVYAVVESTRADEGQGAQGREWKLYADARKIAESSDKDTLRRRLRANAQLFIAATTNQYVFIHAGVVAFGNQAMLIPGRSYSGKTTLVAEFVKAGATYYSDEYAVLDANGMVHPYVRPLSVRGRRSGIQKDVSVTNLGGQSGCEPLPIGLILITKYKKGEQWQPVEAGTKEAAQALVANAVAIRRLPAAYLNAIARVSLKAKVLQGLRGEARATVKEIMKQQVLAG